MKKLITSLAMLLVSFMLQAQTINVSTGIDNSGNPLAQYAVDPNWSIIIPTPMAGLKSSAFPAPTWEAQPVAGTNAGWINNSGDYSGNSLLNTNFTFERTFFVPGSVSSISYSLAFACDDNIVSAEIIRPDNTVITIPYNPLGNPWTLQIPATGSINTAGMPGTWRIRAVGLFYDGIAAFLCSGNVTLNQSQFVLDFNGTNDYAYIDSTFTAARSFELWFKPRQTITSSLPQGQSLLVRNDATQTNEFGLYLIGNDWTTNMGQLAFYVRDNGTLHQIHSNSNVWHANTWYHVAGVIDPVSGMRLYINGVLQAQTDPTGTTAVGSSNEPIALGRWGDAAIRHFDGRMDEVRVWNRAISQNEVLSKMCSALNPATEVGLDSYYRMNEGSGTTIFNENTINMNGNLVTPIYILENVCGTGTSNNCNVISDDFSSSAGWNHPMTARTCSTYYNDIDISGGTFNFYDARDGHTNFMNKSIPTLSNNHFKADIDVTASAFGPSGDVANRVLALTAGPKGFANDESSTTCISTPCAFPTMTCLYSAQMGLEVLLAGNPSTGYNFTLRQNTGAGGYTPLITLGNVPLAGNGLGTYYIRLERTCNTTGQLSVFSDITRTVHVPGSPLTFILPSSFGGLNNVQLGVYEGGWHANRLTGSLDNLCISSNPPTITVTASNVTGCLGSSVNLVGSPAGGTFSVPDPYTGPSTTYTYTYTDPITGCSATSAPATITMNALPTVTAQNVQGCPGCTVTLSGSPAGGTFSVPNPYTGPSTTYTYTYTDPVTGCTATSAPATITISNSLTVTNFVYTATSSNTASLSWDAIPCIAWYTVRYRPLGTSTWAYATGSSASILLTGLTAATSYEAEIRANCSSSSPGVYNSSTSFTTQAPCCTPAGLAISSITASAISINWAACPSPGWYLVRYRINGGAWSSPASSTSNSFTLPSATSGNNYEFQVQYKCSVYDISAWSSILNISVPSASPKPASEGENILQDQLSNTNIKLYPNPVESNLQIQIGSDIASSANIQVLDMSGKLVREQTASLRDGMNVITIDMQSLQSGLYFIKINQAHQASQTFKVSKK